MLIVAHENIPTVTNAQKRAVKDNLETRFVRRRGEPEEDEEFERIRKANEEARKKREEDAARDRAEKEREDARRRRQGEGSSDNWRNTRPYTGGW